VVLATLVNLGHGDDDGNRCTILLFKPRDKVDFCIYGEKEEMMRHFRISFPLANTLVLLDHSLACKTWKTLWQTTGMYCRLTPWWRAAVIRGFYITFGMLK
jgi:hypothetical protein